MYQRLLSDKFLKTSKNILLLGPRQTGKSTLIQSLNPDLTINLALEQTFLDFSAQPDLIEKMIQHSEPTSIFIDEIQRLPSLLNTIQVILDKAPKKYRFFLTGSSARKLKRGGANLLPGRVISFQLGPLSADEMGADLILDDALVYGTLPGIVSEQKQRDKRDLLRTYASTYLKEEIQSEALTKNIEGFARFLFVAASKSGEFLDFSKLGVLASINQKTSSRFFEILEDTLIVTRINAFSRNETRRLVQHPKFYFFDNGVLNGLLKNFTLSEDRKGFLFEHFMINQIITTHFIQGEPARLSTYRTEAGNEVDLLIEKDGDFMCVEIKSSRRLGSKDFSGLYGFADHYGKKHRFILLYDGNHAYQENFIEVLPWQKALKEISAFIGD